MCPKEENPDFQIISKALINAVSEELEKKCRLAFSKDPDVVQKDIIEYEGRLRAPGLSKLDGPCYVTAINYYLTQDDLSNHNTAGALILYMEEDCALKILKAAGVKKFDEDDEALILEHCGEICKRISGTFNTELIQGGYKELVSSELMKGKNEIVEGVEFKYSEYKYIEASFHLWKQKAVVIDVTLPMPLKI